MRIRNSEEGLIFAYKVAQLSQYESIRVGAVVVDKKGNIESFSCNLRKTHPIQFKYAKLAHEDKRIYLHAEIAALIKANKPRKIYVVRIGKKGNRLPAVPCPVCRGLINHLNVEVVHS